MSVPTDNDPSLSDLADEIEAAAKAALHTTSRVAMLGPESLNLWAAALRGAEEEIKRLQANIECYENKKWAEIELALADNKAHRLWEGLFGKPDDILKRAEKAEDALAEMRRIVEDFVNATEHYLNIPIVSARIDAKAALGRHATEGK